MSFRSAFALSRQSLRTAAPAPALRLAGPRLYSTAKAAEPAAEAPAAEAPNAELDAAKEKLDAQSKTIAELKVSQPRPRRCGVRVSSFG